MCGGFGPHSEEVCFDDFRRNANSPLRSVGTSMTGLFNSAQRRKLLQFTYLITMAVWLLFLNIPRKRTCYPKVLERGNFRLVLLLLFLSPTFSYEFVSKRCEIKPMKNLCYLTISHMSISIIGDQFLV